MDALALPRYDADVLTAEKGVADYFEEALVALSSITGKSAAETAKAVSNWVMTDVLRVVSGRKIDIRHFPVSPSNLATMIGMIVDGTISGKIAKEVFEEMVISGDDPRTIVKTRGLIQVSDQGAIDAAVEAVIKGNGSQVGKYLAGNEKVFGFLVGETMKLMKGKANPKMVNDILMQRLKDLKA